MAVSYSPACATPPGPERRMCEKAGWASVGSIAALGLSAPQMMPVSKTTRRAARSAMEAMGQ